MWQVIKGQTKIMGKGGKPFAGRYAGFKMAACESNEYVTEVGIKTSAA
jgi:hypothetical protein